MVAEALVKIQVAHTRQHDSLINSLRKWRGYTRHKLWLARSDSSAAPAEMMGWRDHSEGWTSDDTSSSFVGSLDSYSTAFDV